MTFNCPYWRNRKCAGVHGDYKKPCSFDKPEYYHCPDYHAVKARLDRPRKKDTPPKPEPLSEKQTAAGPKRRLSREALDALSKRYFSPKPKKKWWEFWK